MSGNGGGSLVLVSTGSLKPFASVIVLEFTGGEPGDAIARLMAKLRSFATGSRRGEVRIIASGLRADGDQTTDRVDDAPAADELDAFITVRTTQPAWATVDSLFVDVDHSLTIVIRRSRLIAVHCDGATREKLQRWLSKAPRPPFRRISPGVLQAAFLAGEVKGLWLRGTHARRPTQADGENLTGTRLQDALDPFQHGSFAMGSGRANMPASDDRQALTGTVGTTPRKSLMWAKQTDSFETFKVMILEALILIDEIMTSGGGIDRPFPELAAEVADLGAVREAYDISVQDPEDLPDDASDDLISAAQILHEATLEVRGDPASPNFDLDVGIGGPGEGLLRGLVTQDDDRVLLRFGVKTSQGSPGPNFSAIRKALEETDLLTVRYASGHGLLGEAVVTNDVVESTFSNWLWESFVGFDVRVEKPCTCGHLPKKPCTCSPQEIHDTIARPRDQSLFAWVVDQYGKGWLTCDDGSGEIADFIHLDNDGVLSQIHVKAAKSRSSRRGVAVDAYSVVTAQAVKNLRYTRTADLLAKLARPAVANPASWCQGARTSRDELCDMIATRSPTDETRVVIVQPHQQFGLYRSLKEPGVTGSSGDSLRLELLEYLLNSARRTAIGHSCDLFVIGAQ